jgi:hypothetical protein
VQLGEEGDEVLEATAETINRPGHHHVKSWRVASRWSRSNSGRLSRP